jgi:hypothetical protein
VNPKTFAGLFMFNHSGETFRSRAHYQTFRITPPYLPKSFFRAISIKIPAFHIVKTNIDTVIFPSEFGGVHNQTLSRLNRPVNQFSKNFRIIIQIQIIL